MSIFQALIAALLAPFAAAQEPGIAMASKTSSALACEIRSTPTPGGVRLEAIVMSSVGVSGEYDLIVAKSGGGGTSNISQGGDFEVGPGEETLLGEVTLGAGEQTHVTADLTVTSTDGTLSCADQHP